MYAITDPKQAGERLLQFARENRLAQGTWHDEQNGREVACLLGAAAGITDVRQCPASLVPAWLAHALPELFDGQTKAYAMTFARRWGEAMVRDEWRRIDWDAVRGEWMAFVVKQAQDGDALYSSYAELFAARSADHAASHAGYAADAASYAASCVARAASYASYAAARDARDAQAEALMDAIERAMEVARG